MIYLVGGEQAWDEEDILLLLIQSTSAILNLLCY